MTWAATFQNAVQRDGRWAFSIVFTNGAKKVAREFSSDTLDDATVRNAARSEVAALSRVDVGVGKLTIPDGGVIDLSPDAPPPPVVPTPQEAARTAFFTDVGTMHHYARAVELGLIDGSDARVVDLHAKLVAGFKDEYLDAL